MQVFKDREFIYGLPEIKREEISNAEILQIQVVLLPQLSSDYCLLQK